MTHLTKAEAHGLFTASAPPRPNRETGNEKQGIPMMMEPPKAPFAVAVDMTPDQAREVRRASWPEYDWSSVANLSPRTRGKHY